MKLRICFVLAALCAAAGPLAHADEIYRSVMPNGDVRYGESAFPGAKSVTRVQRPPSGVVVVTPGDKALAGSITTATGGVSVVPQKARPSPQGAPAGTSYSDGSLPKRAY